MADMNTPDPVEQIEKDLANSFEQFRLAKGAYMTGTGASSQIAASHFVQRMLAALDAHYAKLYASRVPDANWTIGKGEDDTNVTISAGKQSRCTCNDHAYSDIICPVHVGKAEPELREALHRLIIENRDETGTIPINDQRVMAGEIMQLFSQHTARAVREATVAQTKRIGNLIKQEHDAMMQAAGMKAYPDGVYTYDSIITDELKSLQEGAAGANSKI